MFETRGGLLNEYVFIIACQTYALVLESHAIGNGRCFSLSCVWWNSNGSDADHNDATNTDRYNGACCNIDSDGCYGKDG